MLFIFNYLQCRAWGGERRAFKAKRFQSLYVMQLFCTQCKRMVDLRIKSDAARLGIKRCSVRDK